MPGETGKASVTDTQQKTVDRTGTGAEPDERPVSVAVVEAVADAEGVDPVGLETPLYEAVDPDALEALVGASGHGGFEGYVSFVYCGYDVTVDPRGGVTLRE